MKLWLFAIIFTIVYGSIVYLINIKIGLYAGFIAIALLKYILPIVTPKDGMSSKEMEELGKKKFGYE